MRAPQPLIFQPKKPKEAEVYNTTEEAKKAGWFSRRHETSDAHRESGRTRKQRKEDKRFEAELRTAARKMRTDEEQLALLIERGHGKCGEALMLKARIERSV